MGLYSGGLIIGRILASEILGAYFWEGLFPEGLIIRILWYLALQRHTPTGGKLTSWLFISMTDDLHLELP